MSDLSQPPSTPPKRITIWQRLFHFGKTLVFFKIWFLVVIWTLWCVGALWFDWSLLPHWIASLYIICLAVLFWRNPAKTWRWAWLITIPGNLFITIWWFQLEPKSSTKWKKEYAKSPIVEWNDDKDHFTIHNFRSFDWKTDKTFIPKWRSQTYALSDLTAADFYCVYWMGPSICHLIVSFEFKNQPPLCISIEAKQPLGANYSILSSLYRQYQLAYVVGDETDIIKVRTNKRIGEDVYIFRMKSTPTQLRNFLISYLNTISELNNHPKWYNALTTNCTSSIRHQLHFDNSIRKWDWRLLVNGYIPERMMEFDTISAEGKSLEELMKQNHVNNLGKKCKEEENFSQKIRSQAIGFEHDS